MEDVCLKRPVTFKYALKYDSYVALYRQKIVFRIIIIKLAFNQRNYHDEKIKTFKLHPFLIHCSFIVD